MRTSEEIETECKRFVTGGGWEKEAKMGESKTTPVPSRPSDRPSPGTQVCAPTMKVAAQNVSWLKVVVSASVVLLAAGATAALYTEQFATNSDVVGAVKAHSEGDGHPVLRKELRDVQDRLIRMEMQQDAMSKVQGAMDDKLDRLIDRASVPAWLIPPSRTAPIP